MADPGADTGSAGRTLRTDLPHPARMYDYYLGGKDNFPADREAAELAIAAFANARVTARENRAFMTRATRHLATQAGISQFLDIGTGIPTSPNLHEVAQSIVAEARVVYADNDPIVLTHARALLASTPQGRTAYIDADLRDPAAILDSPELRATLDLARPVALSLIAIFHFLSDEEDPHAIVRRLVDALPSGSYLVLTHGTADFDPEAEEFAAAYRRRGLPFQLRTHTQVQRLFDGLELVDPGLLLAHHWRPDDDRSTSLRDAQVGIYAGVARKP